MKFEEKLVDDFVFSPAKAEAEVTKAIDWNQPGEASIDSQVILDLEIAKHDGNSAPASVLLHWVDDLLEKEEEKHEEADSEELEKKSLTAEFIPDSEIDGGATEHPPDIDDPWMFSSARRKVPVDDDGDEGGGGGGGGDGEGDDAPTAPDDGDQPKTDEAKAADKAADKAKAEKAKAEKAKAEKPKGDKPKGDAVEKPKTEKPARAPKPSKPDPGTNNS